jgi:hypothetical protein
MMIIVPACIMIWGPNLSAGSNPKYVYIENNSILLTPGKTTSISYGGTFFNTYNTDITKATTQIKFIKKDDKTMVISFNITIENIFSNSQKDFQSDIVIGDETITLLMELSTNKNLVVEHSTINCEFGVVSRPTLEENKNNPNIA